MNDTPLYQGADQVRDALYSPLGDVPYLQVLPRVQTALAASISGNIDELTEQELKEKIRRFLTDNRVKCSLTPDLDELVNYIYHDMAGLSFITRDGLFEKPGFEEININAWNDVEIVVDGRSVKTEYSFLSPQHAIDIHTRMLRKTRTTLNDAIPRATADIGGSICISGETGAGKTTLAGCLLSIASKRLRTFTIEEGSREWNFVHEEDGQVLNSVIHTRTKPNLDNPDLSIGQEELVKDSLRFDPDIIAPGEIRGREAFEVMGVSNTGHTVITTTHSNGTADTPERIVTLAKKAFDMSDATLFGMACRAFPILVHMEAGADKVRWVTEIREVLGYEDGAVQSRMLYEYEVEDNIYQGDECVEVRGRFCHLAELSPQLIKRLLKKGATRAELEPYTSLSHRRKKEGVA